jgi:uncharacterized protein (TIGR03435 family)
MGFGKVWLRGGMLLGLLAGAAGAQAVRPGFDAFEAASVKRAKDEDRGRYIKMEGVNRFVGKAYTLRLLIAAAYELNPKTISGGPGWVDTETFDITARTPGEVRPNHAEQMKMLRSLLTDEFKLSFRREKKEFSVYALELEKGGSRLKATATPEEPTVMGPGLVVPQKITLPGRNATVEDLALLLQRAVLDRPVVDRTGLVGHYDFDLSWAPDSSQFGGAVEDAGETAKSLPLFEAIREQLGLRLEPTRGIVEALVIQGATRPEMD